MPTIVGADLDGKQEVWCLQICLSTNALTMWRVDAKYVLTAEAFEAALLIRSSDVTLRVPPGVPSLLYITTPLPNEGRYMISVNDKVVSKGNMLPGHGVLVFIPAARHGNEINVEFHENPRVDDATTGSDTFTIALVEWFFEKIY